MFVVSGTNTVIDPRKPRGYTAPRALSDSYYPWVSNNDAVRSTTKFVI